MRADAENSPSASLDRMECSPRHMVLWHKNKGVIKTKNLTGQEILNDISQRNTIVLYSDNNKGMTKLRLNYQLSVSQLCYDKSLCDDVKTNTSEVVV